MTPKTYSDEDRLLIAAMNKRVQGGRRAARGDIEQPRFVPPPCARPGCRSAADISERDYTPDRPFFCSEPQCFRIVRDYQTHSGRSGQRNVSIPPMEFVQKWLAGSRPGRGGPRERAGRPEKFKQGR